MSLLSTVHRPLTAEELDLWIAGLESGQHEQHNGSLRSASPDAETGKYGYCCLGLKCQLDGLDLDGIFVEYEDEESDKVIDYLYEHSGLTVEAGETPEPLLGLSHKTRSALASANDSDRFAHTFADLAGVLRRYRDDLLAGRSLDWDYTTNKWTVIEP